MIIDTSKYHPDFGVYCKNKRKIKPKEHVSAEHVTVTAVSKREPNEFMIEGWVPLGDDKKNHMGSFDLKGYQFQRFIEQIHPPMLGPLGGDYIRMLRNLKDADPSKDPTFIELLPYFLVVNIEGKLGKAARGYGETFYPIKTESVEIQGFGMVNEEEGTEKKVILKKDQD